MKKINLCCFYLKKVKLQIANLARGLELIKINLNFSSRDGKNLSLADKCDGVAFE